MGGIAKPPEVLRQEGEVGTEPVAFAVEHLVHPRPDGVAPGHEGSPARAADALSVEGLQQDPLRGQPGQVRGEDVSVVPGDVVVAWFGEERETCDHPTNIGIAGGTHSLSVATLVVVSDGEGSTFGLL